MNLCWGRWARQSSLWNLPALEIQSKANLIRKILIFLISITTREPWADLRLQSGGQYSLERQKRTPPFWGECRECYAYANVALRFEVDITDYDVNRFVAMIDGQLDFNILMDELSVPSTGLQRWI